MFLAIPFALDYVLKHQKLPSFKLLFCCFVICAIPYLFNYFYYGAVLPSSASAKLLQGKSGLWGKNKILNFQSWEWRGIFGFHLRYYLIFIGLAIAGFILNINKRLSIIVGVYLVLLLTFYKWFNIPDYFWYKAPIVYILLTFSLIGFRYLGDKFRIKNEILGSLISVVLLVVFLFKFSLFSLEKTSFIPIRSSIPVTENIDYKNIGKWLSKNTPNNSTIAMVEIGIVGYFADRKIIDILGLVNEHNAEFIGNRDLFSWLTHYQPEYILVHKPIYSWEYSIEPLRKNKYYILDKTFVNPVSEQSYELYRRTENNTENIKALGEEFSKKVLFE